MWTEQHIGQKSSTCAINEQLEHCNKGVCQFRNIDGTCVFESCLYDERPKENGNLEFKCTMCEDIVSRPARELIVGKICKPHEDDLFEVGRHSGWKCVFCGGSFSEERAVPFHNVCQHCREELLKVINAHTCG